MFHSPSIPGRWLCVLLLVLAMLSLPAGADAARRARAAVMINLSNNVRGGEHANREVVRTYMQLGEIGDLLGKGFLRAHQRYLVNIDAIAELNAQGLVLTDGTQIPVSRSRSAEVKEFFLNHVRGA